jgi:GT2 family glycosyltransferase
VLDHRRTYRAFAIATRAAYRIAPVPASLKLSFKHFAFRSAAPMFRATGAYARWREQQQTLAAPTAMPLPAPLDSPPSVVIDRGVPHADGVWEWAERDEVAAKIAALVALPLAEQSALPEMIMVPPDAMAASVDALVLPTAEAPVVSIIVPVFNQIRYTVECLLSIVRSTDAAVTPYEIIIADDCSTDETASLLGGVPGLRIIRTRRNCGFLNNCNNAAEFARGRTLLFLNNDVQVTPGYLTAMLDALDTQPEIGAVGPRIVYPSGCVQEAGTRIRGDASAGMIGLNRSASEERFRLSRRVDYCSGACLLVRADTFRALGGFDTRYSPAYCEDMDLCTRLAEERRLGTWYCADATIIHHLSKSSDSVSSAYKQRLVTRNLQIFAERWPAVLDRAEDVRVIAFYLPQFHPTPQNDRWWGRGFTEWTNVGRARPNFVGHYQPRVPADLGYYDLRLTETALAQQALARRYGIDGFCYYYYSFAGRRLLEMPIERLLQDPRLDLPFCLCWANENWPRRWDGQDQEVLMAQHHSDEDDAAVIRDLMRFFRHPSYIRVNGRPLIVVCRVELFPDFVRTASIWRKICREEGIGEIHLVHIESFDLSLRGAPPSEFGCDASIEFPPHGMARERPPEGATLNPDFAGAAADYQEIAISFASRPAPAYRRYRGVMPGWDNTARRQNDSYCFENATPGAFQAWMEAAIAATREEAHGDERLIFVNAWNEWAEGAYLEPDLRFGHAFLDAVARAKEAGMLLRPRPGLAA